MEVKLIPVLEINCGDTDVLSPGKSPYWLYPDDYDNYHKACSSNPGFKDEFVFYLKGSTFVKVNNISIPNLEKIIKRSVEGILSAELSRNEGAYLSGGYVLNIDRKDVYFPQCCSELAGISYWEGIAYDFRPYYEDGHPSPVLTFTRDEIVFDFEAGEIGERFAPPPVFKKLRINKMNLQVAVDAAKRELIVFGEKIMGINTDLNLNIADIDKLLIWGDD